MWDLSLEIEMATGMVPSSIAHAAAPGGPSTALVVLGALDTLSERPV